MAYTEHKGSGHMKQWQVEVNNASFEKVRITKDCQEAICEFILNGFEAKATRVEIVQIGTPLVDPISVQVIDNGKGIIFENLNETFGAFLSTTKNTESIRIKSQSNQGKGRFSYASFSSQAQWSTVYEKANELMKYTISMNSAEKRNFATSDVINAGADEATGTVVEFPILESANMGQLSYESIEQKLLQEFSWFLYLNKMKSFELNYMGTVLDFEQYIDTDLSTEKTIDIQGKLFLINLIIWKNNIDNASKVFYLGESGEIYAADNTGFNKNTVDFFHNVFVTSSYINSQTKHLITSTENAAQVSIDETTRAVFAQLKKEVHAMIVETLRKFLIPRADKALSDMEERGTTPVFSDDEYGELRKKDFMSVTKELYCVEPRIFHKLKPEQEKSLLGFMNLLLSSDERENILSIVEHVVSLTSEQRNSFADILQRTKLQYILDSIVVIDRRLAAIAQLKRIVFELAKFANERDHVQKIVEKHFWLFGEQYHMLTADKTLATSLSEYEKITDTQSPSKAKRGKNKKELNQRADIFLYTKRVQEDSSSEMLIVELKAPSVPLSIDVYNQVVRYANTIRKVPQFSGTNRKWRFYAICSTVEDDVKVKYKNFVQHGKNGLVDVIEDNFEIYALSWDDVFQSFEARHSFLLEKLKIDYTQVSSEIKNEHDVAPSRSLVNDINARLTTMQAR